MLFQECVKLCELFLTEVEPAVSAKQPDSVTEMQKSQKQFNVIASTFTEGDVKSLTVEQAVAMLSYIGSLHAFDDYVNTLMSARIIAMVNMTMSRSTVEYLQRMKQRAMTILPLIADNFMILQRSIIEHFGSQTYDPQSLLKICTEYNNYNVYVYARRGESLSELAAIYASRLEISEYPPIEKLGQDCLFNLRSLVDDKYIIEHELAGETPEKGISLAGINATKTIVLGQPGDKVERRYHSWSDEQVRVEKGIAVVISEISAKINATLVDHNAVLAAQVQASRQLRTDKMGDTDSKLIKIKAGQSIVETMDFNDIQDLWRIKEILNFKTNQEKMGKRDINTAIFRNKSFRPNEVPMATIYERMVANLNR